MSLYIKFVTEDGGTILVEVAEDESQSGLEMAGLRGRVEGAIAQAKDSFEDSLEIVRRNAAAFVSKVRSLSDPPHEMEVTFGLKATGEVGNFAIANVGAEASYTVTLRWKHETDKKLVPKPSRRGSSRYR